LKVESGQECLDKILNGEKYDLIFLDIMMPKMKGTEVLQHLQTITNFDTPVIALTADVITGMEEKYISLGFNDCLAKPILEEKLYLILKKFLYQNAYNKAKIVYVEKENTTGNRNTELLKEKVVNVDNALTLLKDLEMYNMTIEQYYQELPEKLNQLEKYMQTNDMNNYNILVHSLKSESKYVGLDTLAKIAYDHEMASKQENIDFVKKNFQNLTQEAEIVYNIIREYLGDDK
jgi:CheY-like chemotaxis protein